MKKKKREIIKDVMCSSSKSDMILRLFFSSHDVLGHSQSCNHPPKEKSSLVHIPTHFLDFFFFF